MKSPKVYGVWTDANGSNLTSPSAAPVEYFNLMMEDMNQEWKTFNPVVDGAHSSEKETEEMLMLARDMHVKYFKDASITSAPISKTGETFSLDAKRPYVGYATASWPPVRENFPKLAEGQGGFPADGGFPAHAEKLVAFYDKYLGDAESWRQSS